MSLNNAIDDLARAYEEQRRPGNNHLMTEALALAIEQVLATRGAPLVADPAAADDWACKREGYHLRATRHTEDECGSAGARNARWAKTRRN